MAKTNWQDPKSSEIISPHISGLQEAIGKLEESLGISSVVEEGILLSEVYIAESDRYRIYQAPEGKRNWLSSPTPIIKKNGVEITTDFIIEYGGGAIVFTTPLLSTDVVTADATYTVKEATSLKEQINSFASQVVSEKVEATNTDDATSVTDAPLKSAGGLGIAKDIYMGGRLFSNNLRKILYLDHRMLGTLSPTQRLRINFIPRYGYPCLVKVCFISGVNNSTFANADVLEKSMLFHLYQNNITDVIESNVQVIKGYTEQNQGDNVYLEAVGDNDEVNLIIQSVTIGNKYFACIIEVIGTYSEPTILEAVVEDRP